jgi:hypothetical protein
MNDEQRFAELPSHSRMAWSSRPVWDRRPPVGERRDHRPDLGLARRYRTRDAHRSSSVDRVHAMARSQSLVITSSRSREKHL